MQQILEYLAAHCAFLWSSGRFRITGSTVTTGLAGDAALVVESDLLRLRFLSERGRLFLEFQQAGADERELWYSIDLVLRLVTGERHDSAVLDPGHATVVQAQLTEIETRFSTDLAATKEELRTLMKKRGKELFG